MIVENRYLDELLDIFDNNNKNYVVDRTASQRMPVVVYVKDEEPVGYGVVYIGKDFCEQEEYPITIEEAKDDSVYIWQLVTKQGFENQGIATSIVRYITEKYKDHDIYVSVNINNYASMKCQCKCGFVPIKAFDDNGKTHIILKKEQVIEN